MLEEEEVEVDEVEILGGGAEDDAGMWEVEGPDEVGLAVWDGSDSEVVVDSVVEGLEEFIPACALACASSIPVPRATSLFLVFLPFLLMLVVQRGMGGEGGELRAIRAGLEAEVDRERTEVSR